jgi:tRNA A37 N6-isopentenylltransferase MiaA
MKTVSIAEVNGFSPIGLARELLSVDHKGVNFNQFRKRVRILELLEETEKKIKDAVEKEVTDAKTYLLHLEDEDFNVLKGVIENATFQIIRPEVMKILDALMNPIKPEEKKE